LFLGIFPQTGGCRRLHPRQLAASRYENLAEFNRIRLSATPPPPHDRLRLEDEVDAAIAAARAHHAVAEGRQRHVASAHPDERLEAQLGLVAAFGRRARIFDSAPEAARMHPPASRQQRISPGVNIKGTSAPDCQVGRS